MFNTLWPKDVIKWYVDDQLYLTITLTDVGNAIYPFTADQFFYF